MSEKQGPKLSVDASLVLLQASSLSERESVDLCTEGPWCRGMALEWSTGHEGEPW